MGCGCGKPKGVTTPPPTTPGARVAAAQASGNVIMYDVFDSEGSLVASYSNPVLARAEARRSNGTAVPRRSNDPIATSPATA